LVTNRRRLTATLTLDFWEKLTPSNGGGLEEGLLGQLGLDAGRRSFQIWPPATDLRRRGGSLSGARGEGSGVQ
jgi:hypothetical protein